MFRIKNTTSGGYVMMHSYYNGIPRTPETVNVKLARKYTKAEAKQVLSQISNNNEFKTYSIEKAC